MWVVFLAPSRRGLPRIVLVKANPVNVRDVHYVHFSYGMRKYANHDF